MVTLVQIKITFVTLFLLCFASTQVMAFPLVYRSQQAFNEAVGQDDIHQENFEQRAIFGDHSSGGLNEAVFGALTVKTSIPAIKIFKSAYSGNHNMTPGGRRYLSIDTDLYRKGTTGSLAFLNPLTALGFWIVDQESTNLDLWLGNDHIVIPRGKNSQQQYIGLVPMAGDDMIRSLTFDTGGDSQVAIDDFSWKTVNAIDQSGSSAQSVEEPGSFVLLLAGLMMFLRRAAHGGAAIDRMVNASQ